MVVQEEADLVKDEVDKLPPMKIDPPQRLPNTEHGTSRKPSDVLLGNMCP